MAARPSSAHPGRARTTLRAIGGVLAALAGSAMLLSIPSLAPLGRQAPFTGKWQPANPGGGSTSLVIGGRPAGPFAVTWMDDRSTLCGAEPAILHGTASLDPWDPNALNADVQAGCSAGDKGPARSVRLSLRPLDGTLSLQDAQGTASLWTRSPDFAAPPALNLRVNYGDDWLEGFYEAGHTVWVTVTEPDGVTQKAALEVFTEPKDYWQGEPGFSSLDSIWLDREGHPLGRLPDIQVGDWVFGWADNGASSSIQIGDIRGVVDAAHDSIEGTIRAPWLSEVVVIECLDWWSGRGGPSQPYPNRSGGFVHANGADRYSCSWAGEWDIRESHGIGVAYTDENDGWVANSFRTGFFTVFPEQNALEGWDWPDGAIITATIDGRPMCTARSTAGYSEQSRESTFVWIDFPLGCAPAVGDRVALTDGTMSLSHTIQKLAISSVDAAADTVSGIAEDGPQIYAWVHGHNEDTLRLTARGGRWLADFGSSGFDITDGMCGRAEIRDAGGLRTAVDWCLPNP